MKSSYSDSLANTTWDASTMLYLRQSLREKKYLLFKEKVVFLFLVYYNIK